MSLYEKWTGVAYDSTGGSVKKFWDVYMPLEQRIYEDLLASGGNRLSGKVAAFAEKYGMKPEYVCGFLDGISGALDEKPDVENLTEESDIDITVDFERLLRKMVEYKAKHLYSLQAWDKVFTPEERERVIDEQKRSTTFVRDEKIGRNDPCPCGSGKKYKKCCGAAS